MPPLNTGQKQRIVIIDKNGIVKGEVASLFSTTGERLATIDAVHEEIHEGNAFSVSQDFLAVADDAMVEFLFTVGASKNAHIVAEIESEGKGNFELFEAPSVSANGTVMTPRNKFRGFDSNPDQSTMLVFHTPTIDSDAGTRLQVELVPGGLGPQSIGASGGSRDEWVFAEGVTYLWRFTNKSGQAKDVTMHLEWYEENIENM